MSAPDLYSFVVLEPPATLDDRRVAAARLQADNGATFFRFTIVNDDYPNEPYPHGIYVEGWCERPDVQPPFDYPLSARAA